MGDNIEISAPGRIPMAIHWTANPRLVTIRTLVGDAGVEIDLTPAQALAVADMLIDGASLATGHQQ